MSSSVKQFAAAAKVAFGEAEAPGAEIAVADSRGLLISMALGRRRLDRQDRVRPDDPFHLASVTKPMTAALIAMLIADGRLGWNSTPALVWPGEASRMDARARDITLQQLLDHRSGLAPFIDLDEIAGASHFKGSEQMQRRSFAVWLLRQRPMFARGQFHYSNAGYAVATAMAESVTGTEWRKLMDTRLFRPLGMTSCGFGWPVERDPSWPVGHWRRGNHLEAQTASERYRVQPFLAPAEDVSCDAGDLAEFGRAWLTALNGRGLLAPLARDSMTATPLGGYSRGWQLGAGALYHLGGAGTFHAALMIYPPRDLAIAVLVNAGSDRPGAPFINTVLSAALTSFGSRNPRR